jgi:hypothetical protein
MSKPVSSHLYELIWSLSSAEKRYFKIFTSRQAEQSRQQSLRIFEIIDKNKGKEIPKIERKLEDFPHLPRLKNYLYELVLKSLDAFHSDSTHTMTIRKNLNYIEILYSRALYKQCAKLIRKTGKVAESIDNKALQLQLLAWEIRLFKHYEYRGRVKLMNELFISEKKLIQQFKDERKYFELSTRIWEELKNEEIGSGETIIQRMEEHLENPFLEEYSLAQTFSSKWAFNNMHAQYHYNKADFKQASHFLKRNIELFDVYPMMKQSEIGDYITTLSNYCVSCIGFKNFERAFQYFDVIENLPVKARHQKIRIFEQVACNKSEGYLKMGKFEDSDDLLEYMQKGLDQFKNKLNKLYETLILYNLSYLFLGQGDYKSALTYNSKILQDGYDFFRKDIHSYARILNLILHYELGDRISIEYFLKSTQRFLKQNRQQSEEVEYWVVDFIAELIRLKSAEEELQFFQQKEMELLDLMMDKRNRETTAYFNFPAWMYSKAEKISYQKAFETYNSSSFEEYKALRQVVIS